MSKLDDAIEAAKTQMKAQGIPCNGELLAKIAKGLGPSIYTPDGKLVAASDADEIATVKKNFIGKKLGVTDEAAQDEAIAYAIEKIGSSNRQKLRTVFSYLIVKKLKKESVYA